MSVIDYKDYKQNFTIIQRLGKGNCASVFKIRHIRTLQYFALKYSRFESVDKLASALQQVQVVRAIDHPTAIRIFYSFVKPIPSNHQKGEFGIIMELAQRSLQQDMLLRRKKYQFYRQSQLQQLTITLIQFFAHAQTKGYMHRDIKPANILIMPEPINKNQLTSKINSNIKKYSMNIQPQNTVEKAQNQQRQRQRLKNNVYKVCDFGFATKQHEFSSKNIAGTACYASPKIHTKFKNTQSCIQGNNFKDDVFSLGVTLIQLASLQSAELIPPNRLLFNINNKYGLRFSQLLQSMIQFQQRKRPDFIGLKQNYKNYIGISNKIINNPNININNMNNMNNMNRFIQYQVKLNKNVSIPQITQQNKLKPPQLKHPQLKHPQLKHPQLKHPSLKHPQLKHKFLTEKKLKQLKLSKINQQQLQQKQLSQKQLSQKQLSQKQLKQKGKYTFETADSQSCGNIKPIWRRNYDKIKKSKISKKNKKFVIDQYDNIIERQVKNKKFVIDQYDSIIGRQEKNKKLQKQHKNKIKQQKKKKQNYLQQNYNKKQSTYHQNLDKIKTKRRSKIIQPISHYKIQYFEKTKHHDRNKRKPDQIYIQIDDQPQNNYHNQVKKYFEIQSTVESDGKNHKYLNNQLRILAKTNIKNIKPNLISYIISNPNPNTNTNTNPNTNNKQLQILQHKIQTIICVGDQNYVYFYYKMNKTQSIYCLCVILPENQKLLQLQYKVHTQKLAIVSENSTIRVINTDTIKKIINKSIDSKIKSIYVEEIQTISNYYTETNSTNLFYFGDYLESLMKIKNDGTLWENGRYLGNIPSNKVKMVKFIRKVNDYLYLGSCQGELFRYGINCGSYWVQQQKLQVNDLNKKGNKNITGYFNCKNTLIGFQIIRCSTITKIIAISATGFLYILNQNLQLISMKNISKNCLLACNISLKLSYLLQNYSICMVDCFGNLINEQGQLIGQTGIQECGSIGVDYDEGIIIMISGNGIIYELNIKQSDQTNYQQQDVQINLCPKRRRNKSGHLETKSDNYRMYSSLPL